MKFENFIKILTDKQLLRFLKHKNYYLSHDILGPLPFFFFFLTLLSYLSIFSYRSPLSTKTKPIERRVKRTFVTSK